MEWTVEISDEGGQKLWIAKVLEGMVWKGLQASR